MAPLNSMMLIAVPQLVDPNFKRSVVLILHHDEEGAFGLVVNDPTNLSLRDFAQAQNLGLHLGHFSQPVYCGGPVEPYRGWILHEQEGLEEKQEISPGLYVSGSNETLKEVLEGQDSHFRFLLGYAGWGPSQLEKELEDGSWITTPVESKYIFFNNPGDTWDAMLHDMGVDPATLAHGHGLH
jgi:putative transcriptional regulator